MLVKFKMDRIGGITATVSQKWAKKIDAHMRDLKSAGAPQNEGTRGRYFQGMYELDPEGELFSKAQLRDLNNGWSVSKRMDPWIALHYWGWDAHTLAE
jgi:hypothetical protein